MQTHYVRMPLHGPDKSVPEIVNSASFLPFPLFYLLLLGWMDTGADAPKCEKHRWFSGAVFPIKSRFSLSPNALVPSQSQMLSLLYLREGKNLLPKMGCWCQSHRTGDWPFPHLCAPLLLSREYFFPYPPLLFSGLTPFLPCAENHSDINQWWSGLFSALSSYVVSSFSSAATLLSPSICSHLCSTSGA